MEKTVKEYIEKHGLTEITYYSIDMDNILEVYYLPTNIFIQLSNGLSKEQMVNATIDCVTNEYWGDIEYKARNLSKEELEINTYFFESNNLEDFNDMYTYGLAVEQFKLSGNPDEVDKRLNKMFDCDYKRFINNLVVMVMRNKFYKLSEKASNMLVDFQELSTEEKVQITQSFLNELRHEEPFIDILFRD